MSWREEEKEKITLLKDTTTEKGTLKITSVTDYVISRARDRKRRDRKRRKEEIEKGERKREGERKRKWDVNHLFSVLFLIFSSFNVVSREWLKENRSGTFSLSLSLSLPSH